MNERFRFDAGQTIDLSIDDACPLSSTSLDNEALAEEKDEEREELELKFEINRLIEVTLYISTIIIRPSKGWNTHRN